jgi:hypothetical protein
MSEKPYNEEQDGGKRLNQGLFCVCLFASAYSVYILIQLAITPENKDDIFLFFFYCAEILGSIVLMRIFARNLKKIKARSSRT